MTIEMGYLAAAICNGENPSESGWLPPRLFGDRSGARGVPVRIENSFVSDFGAVVGAQWRKILGSPQRHAESPRESSKPRWLWRLSKRRKRSTKIAARHELHPHQVAQWKKQLQQDAPVVFDGGASSGMAAAQGHEVELHEQIGLVTLDGEDVGFGTETAEP